MVEKEKIVFENFADSEGLLFTSCSLEDNPEIIVAVMGENLPDDYPNPQNLERKYIVSLPANSVGIATDVTIWFSQASDPGILAHVIQGFFDNRFPDLIADDNTKMGIYEPGKIGIKSQ